MPKLELLTTDSDEALAARALRGEREAEAVLIRRLYPGVQSLASRMLRDAEISRDAAQEAFLRAFSRLDQFDGSHRFSAWLFRILVNVIRDDARRGKIASIDAEPDRQTSASLSPGEVMVREEDIAQIRARIAALPENLRLPLLLHYQQGLGGREVAYVLGITYQAARLKIWRGIAQIRAQLAEEP